MSLPDRHICIHGHFYQPPRENPWLEEVEVQDSAFPYHDWNRRIAAECYGPNAASRILNAEKRIVDIVDNYEKISFNFGPTLLAWLERHEPWIYAKILEADRKSLERFSGHGSALAQSYNHIILPLADARDKRTQVVWGLADFEHRFGRKPEGMWLPETAVDTATLEVLAAEGLRFTILSQGQARRVRPLGTGAWTDVPGGRIDPKRPYLCRLPSGRDLALFFYDGPISRDIAFGRLLESGEGFGGRLLGAFSGREEGAELVHIATDGETYGHHHRFGDMALAYALRTVERDERTRLTNYGEFLESHPPAAEVEIVENSSWSCSHGVERWRGDCGCSTGANPGWHQAWRAPLRQAMDDLRDGLAGLFEKEAAAVFPDPWKARDDYIRVVLDRSPESVGAYFARNAGAEPAPQGRARALKLLEMERHAQLMFTSCGWFFDDVTGIETVQVLQYAARAMQLARECGGIDPEPAFVRTLEKARGNLPRLPHGAAVYEEHVRPAVIDLLRVGVHYAISSLFERYPKKVGIGAYTVAGLGSDRSSAGRQSLLVGRALVRSEILGEEEKLRFAVLHLGGHDLIAAARTHGGADGFLKIRTEIKEAFGRSDIPGVIQLMERHFGARRFSLRHLFRDVRRKVLDTVLQSALADVESSLRRVHGDHYPLMQVLRDLQIPVPGTLVSTAEFVLNADLRRLLADKDPDPEKARQLASEFERWALTMDKSVLNFEAERKIDSLFEALSGDPEDPDLLEALEKVFRMVKTLGLEPNLWKSQNIYFAIQRGLERAGEDGRTGARPSEERARLKRLGAQLYFAVD
jgi:alpha-amylase/alpha-mannosidase (GH57 family)